MKRLPVSRLFLGAAFCLAPLLLVACDPAPGELHLCSELETFLNDPNMKLAVPLLVVNYPGVAPEQFRVIYDPGESMFDADTGFRVEDALVQCPHLTFPSDVGW